MHLLYQVAAAIGSNATTLAHCFDPMSSAAEKAFLTSGIMSIITAISEV
jgi:hypothetical protein